MQTTFCHCKVVISKKGSRDRTTSIDVAWFDAFRLSLPRQSNWDSNLEISTDYRVEVEGNKTLLFFMCAPSNRLNFIFNSLTLNA